MIGGGDVYRASRAAEDAGAMYIFLEEFRERVIPFSHKKNSVHVFCK
jgi:hypothetical protein